MSEIGRDVLIIALLILANGVFAMSEMAVVTARKSRLRTGRAGAIRGRKQLWSLPTHQATSYWRYK